MKTHVDFSTFSVRGCWGQPMLLFWKMVNETQMPKPQEYTDTFIITQKLFLVCLWGLQNLSKGVETPCTTRALQVTTRCCVGRFCNTFKIFFKLISAISRQYYEICQSNIEHTFVHIRGKTFGVILKVNPPKICFMESLRHTAILK